MNEYLHDGWWVVTRWFRPTWWRYMLRGCRGWTNFWCRVRGHPAGPIYYRADGDEPDWRCRNCRENIG